MRLRERTGDSEEGLARSEDMNGRANGVDVDMMRVLQGVARITLIQKMMPPSIWSAFSANSEKRTLNVRKRITNR